MNFENSNGNSYNNADSFAMAFDTAWNEFDYEQNKQLSKEEKIKIIFEKMKDHPFLTQNPIQSKNIAIFRIKLLGLS